MRRRQAIALVGAAAFCPFAALAQQGKVPRIGVLALTNIDAQVFGKELRDGLRELGYLEGQNYLVELRSAEGNNDRLPGLAGSWSAFMST